MDNNEITMNLYVKMDIHDKRNESHKFKVWTKCRVKIEAIKCLPCFLRLSFMPIEIGFLNENSLPEQEFQKQRVTVSINVPGVSISLATSRTKQFSYGLFWTHNRRDCFIYFALDTEASCRLHMKWIKKSIKNLELYRQVFLEQRRSSRNIDNANCHIKNSNINCKFDELTAATKSFNSLGPLPKTADSFDINLSSWSMRVSRASAIYEEIFESSRIARRISRASIASGIYEEMKPTPTSSENSCNVISEECDVDQPPPVPPLPAIRKRINTYCNEYGTPGEIPRSSTNPESEMATKKKYKTMIDNFFCGRSKRANTVTERKPGNGEGFIQPIPLPIYMKDIVGKCFRDHNVNIDKIKKPNRNSFSSPDLSKINLLDTFDEECIVDVLHNSSFDCSFAVDLSTSNLEDEVEKQKPSILSEYKETQMTSMDSLNISEQIPTNFNFSACNTSTVNLVGASGAVLSQVSLNNQKMLIDEKTGYCLMTPILKNTLERVVPKVGYTSSGYSGISALLNLAEEPRSTDQNRSNKEYQFGAKFECTEESVIYENMCGSTTNSMKIVTPIHANCSEHFYENLLTRKAANELEPTNLLATSTPTDSPHACVNISNLNADPLEEESYYQTPRKSVISIDEKISSYYPNSCDSVKMRQPSKSPIYFLTSANNCERSCDSVHELKHLVGRKLQRDRKENVYMSSPTKLIGEQQLNSIAGHQKKSKAPKGKKTAAHKVAENVYAVRYINNVSAKPAPTNKNYKLTNSNGASNFSQTTSDRLQSDLLQLGILQNIDFKFDDTKSLVTIKQQPQTEITVVDKIIPMTAITNNNQSYEAIDSTTHMMEGYGCISEYDGKTCTASSVQKSDAHTNGSTCLTGKTPQRHLPTHQQGEHLLPAFNATITQSSASKLKTRTKIIDDLQQLQGIKKFASLPRFSRIDFSPLKMRINNVLQRNQPHIPGVHHDF